MKRVIICIVIMTTVVALSLWGIFQIQSLRKEFDSLISKSESLVLQRDTSSADRYLKEFINEWEAYRKKISFVCNNNDLKEISYMISRLEFQLYTSPECYFENCIALRERILALFETEIPDFEGVF